MEQPKKSTYKKKITANTQADVLKTEYQVARVRKLQNEAEIKNQQKILERIKKEKLLGSLVSLSEAKAAFVALGARTKARLNRLISELPPKLEGLDAQDMIDIIRDAIDEVCQDLYNETSLEAKEIPTDQLEILIEDNDIEDPEQLDDL